MSGSRWLAAAALVTAAWLGKGLLGAEVDADHEPVLPVARHVDEVPVAVDWTPDPDVRDPFLPLVPAPSNDAADTPAG